MWLRTLKHLVINALILKYVNKEAKKMANGKTSLNVTLITSELLK